jgi:hypothetical protein
MRKRARNKEAPREILGLQKRGNYQCNSDGRGRIDGDENLGARQVTFHRFALSRI